MAQIFEVSFKYSQEEVELMNLIKIYLTIRYGEDKRGKGHGTNSAELKSITKEVQQKYGSVNMLFQRIKQTGKDLKWFLNSVSDLETCVNTLTKRKWEDCQECAFFNNIVTAKKAADKSGSEYRIRVFDARNNDNITHKIIFTK